MKTTFYLLYLCIFILDQTNAQNNPPIYSDQSANFIVLSDTLTYPIAENSFSNNLVLLKIQAQKSGFLTFNISSNYPNETINFSLFKNDNNLNIEDLINHRTKPVRYNYSNTDTNAFVLTGLNKASKSNYTEKNSKNKFNSQLWITEQEVIYLLLERKSSQKLQNYFIKFQITEVSCFKIPITNDKGKLVTSVVQYYYNNLNWWLSDNEAKKIDCCYHSEKKLHQLTVVTTDYFPHILDVKILCRNYIDTLKLKLFNTDSVYKLQLIYFDNSNKLDIQKSKISLDTYVEFIKKHKIPKFIILHDSLDANNTAQATELYAYFKSKFPLNKKIELLQKTSNNQNNDVGLSMIFRK